MMRCPPAFSLAAFLLGLAAGCGKTDSPNARPGPPGSTAPRSVRVVSPEIRPLERSTQVVGTLAAYEETLVSAQVAGQIEKMRVDLGDRVATGHELAQIDTTSFEALARQSAAVLSKAAASAENAARTLARIQDLQSNNIASTSELDQAVAEAAQARAEVKSAEAADAIAQLNLQRSHVKAPFDGAVAERLASVGAYVAVGTPIVRMVKTDPLRLRLLVPERESVDVKSGQAARVTLEKDTNTYLGTISRVAPAVRESDRMLLVEADVPNPGTLRAGLFARARIIVRTDDPGLTLPISALSTFAGIEKVVIVKEGKAVETPVSTGRRGPGWVEITSGLQGGELVALSPAGLRTGQPVAMEGETSDGGGPAAGPPTVGAHSVQ